MTVQTKKATFLSGKTNCIHCCLANERLKTSSILKNHGVSPPKQHKKHTLNVFVGRYGTKNITTQSLNQKQMKK